MKLNYFVLLIMFALLFSCSKENIESNVTEEIDPSKISLKAAFVPTPDFDWENANTITYKGVEYSLPWNGSNGANIPLEIRNDFRKSDGWRLLYNTFPSNEEDPVLILYNAYTGTVRAFVYVTSSSYTNNAFTWGAGATTTYGYKTSAFNFSWPTPLPNDNRKSNPCLIKANWSSDPNLFPNGIVPGYWYCCDFQVSYDNLISTLTRDQIELQIRGFATEKKYIQTTGTITGSLTGTFNMPKSGSTGLISGLFSTLLGGVSNDSTFISLDKKDAIINKLTQDITKQKNTTLKNLLNLGLNEYVVGAMTSTNPLLGIITNSIFGSKATSTGKVDLSLKATTTEGGTITSSLPGPAKSFFFPGSITGSSQIGGPLPNYTKKIGVWNLDKQPTLKYGYVIAYADDPYRFQNFSLDLNSFTVLVNPDVTGFEGATITSTKKELIFYDDGLYESGGTLIDSGTTDTYKGNDITLMWGGSPRPATTYYNLGYRGSWGVRITVALRPVGYTTDIIMVKEFKPKYVFDSTLL